MRVTVTGATGFIGGHLVERLVSEGHQVTALARRAESLAALRALGAAVVHGDVFDRRALEGAIAGADVVLHLARAKAHGARPREVFLVNVAGTRSVARATRSCGVARFVYASSSGVYGARPGFVSETTKPAPDSAYARSKLQAEEAGVRECGDRVAMVTARITAVMGRRCRSWLPLFRSAATGRLRLIGDGSNMQHPADVSDIVDGLIRCGTRAEAPGNTYNLAGPESLPIFDMRELMAEAAAPGVQVNHPRPYPRAIIDAYYRAGRITDRIAGLRPPLFESVAFLTGNRVLDIAKARRELGYQPTVTPRAAAMQTAAWYREVKLLPDVTS
jgi:nucleoside-diphosphate-sugar epimerase